MWLHGPMESRIYSYQYTSFVLFFIIVDFLSYIWQFILFKILFQLYKIISCVWTLFSDTTNHNKIYNIFNFFNKVKHNLKSQWRQ
jgi:hypothetical protein